MVDFIDGIWLKVIPMMPNWKWTSRLMSWRHSWYSRYRKWDDDLKQWVKI